MPPRDEGNREKREMRTSKVRLEAIAAVCRAAVEGRCENGRVGGEMMRVGGGERKMSKRAKWALR